MASDNELNSSAQQLAAQLETLRKDLYKLVDNAVANIARTCAGISPDVFKDVVASVFAPLAQSDDKIMAGAAPAMATRVPSPKTVAKQVKEPKRRGRRAVWANSSDKALRQAYANRIKAGKPIEPELESELITRFPTYDAATHKFTGRVRKGNAAAMAPVDAPVAAPKFDNDIVALTHLSSPKNKNGKHPLLFDGETILLRGADKPYELVLFDKKTKFAVVRKEFDDRRYKLFIVKCKKGKILEEMRIGARDIRYIPETHQLMAREMPEAVKRFMVYTPNKAPEMWTVVPDGAISISAQKMLKETIVIEEDGRVTTYPLINLAGIDNAPKTEKVIFTPKQNVKIRKPRTPKTPTPAIVPAPKPIVAEPVVEQKIEIPAPAVEQEIPARTETVIPARTETVAPAPSRVAPKPAPIAPVESKPASVAKPKPDLVVTTRMTKMTLGAVFYDVFVNGKRILQNHIDTEIKLFLDGTVLGVYGRVTDIDNMPDAPSWQVYDTNLKRRDFSYVSTFSKKSVFIKDVRPINATQISLEISNKMRVILDKKNVQQVFKIGSEKTK